MAGKKMHSAKRKRFINNTIVHVILAILAVIWVFPIVWVILTSFRAEKGSYVSTFLPQSFTIDNYVKLFTDTAILNFPGSIDPLLYRSRGFRFRPTAQIFKMHRGNFHHNINPVQHGAGNPAAITLHRLL